MRITHPTFIALLAIGLLSNGCGDGTRTKGTTTSAAPTSGEPLGIDEPGAPIEFRYAVNGSPVVGKPVSVSVTLTTPVEDRPIRLTYRAPEAGSLTFPESQATSVDVLPIGDAERRPLQVTVIPQRDGRVFLTVVASMETDTGAVMRSISIPLQVARAPLESLQESEADGE